MRSIHLTPLRPPLLVTAVLLAACAQPGGQRDAPPKPPQPPAHAPEVLSALDEARIYAAAIGADPNDHRPRGALGRYRMSGDRYINGGLLSDTIIHYLRANANFSEVCGELGDDDPVPVCKTREATSETRFSRPIRVARDTVDVYVGGGSARPANATSTLYMGMGSTLRCHVAYVAGEWMRARCWPTMIV